MKGLTQKQLDVLKAIDLYTKEHGISPTLRELKTLLGLSSQATVHAHLKTLKEKKALNYEPKSPRSVTLTIEKESEEKTIPLFGVLSEKKGIEPFRSPGKIRFSTETIKDLKSTYAIRVKGKFLKPESIEEHDILIIEATSLFTPNALILGRQQEGPYFVKRILPQGRSVILYSTTDPSQELTIPINELKVIGIVLSLIRNFEDL
jgi:repressor LexA